MKRKNLKVVHLKMSDRKKLIEIFEKQNGRVCPVLKFETHNMVIDHIHRQTKKLEVSQENGGFVRGMIDNGVNCLLGVIENNYKRYITKDISLPELLRNMADYIEQGAFVYKGQMFSHWSENGNGDLIKALSIPFKVSDFKKYEKACAQLNRKPLKYKPKIDKKIAIEFVSTGIAFTNFSMETIERLLSEMENGIQESFTS